LDSWEHNLSDSLIRWIAILPMLSAVVNGLLIGILRSKISARSVWTISISSLCASFALSMVSLFELVGDSPSAPILDTLGPWIGGGVGLRSFSAELTFQFDSLSAVFCLVVLAIALATYVYTIGLQRSGEIDPESGHRTFAVLDLLVGSTLVLVLADNFLLFFLGWAGVGFATQLFSSFRFDAKDSARAGATTFVIARVGDLGLLGAMLLLFDGLSRAGAASLTFRGIRGAYRLLEGQEVVLVQQTGIGAPLLLEWVGFGLVLAAVTKCAQLPLHIWLPTRIAVPIPAAALMQSATTVVAGVYVLLRFSFLLESAPIAMSTLIVLGAATMLLASLAAATQLDLARFLAYTTSSHLGLVLIGVGLGAYPSATFHLLTHAFIKAHLILALGIVTVAMRGETDLRKMGGFGHQMRWTQGLVAIGFLALAGFPLLSGFFSIEELLAFVDLSGRPGSAWLLATILSSLVILAFGMARVFFLVFQGNVRPTGALVDRLQDPAGWTQHALTGIAVMTVVAGWLTQSQFWGDLGDVAKSDSVGHFLVHSIAGVPDPGLIGAPRVRLVFALVATLGIGFGLAYSRYARRGYRGESERPAVRIALTTMREMFYIDELYRIVLVRPLRAASQWGLVVGIEQRLLDRVVVTGGSGLVRRAVWNGLRRIQNGRLQSYALLSLLTVVVIVTWMVG
jgi:NADH-quinone oxidoreductase subunit L